MTRRWWVHRQAYSPRLWPMLLACAAVTELVYVGFYVAGVRLGALAAGGLGLVVATAVCQARLWWWRRRHPILAPQQVMARMRETARWN